MNLFQVLSLTATLSLSGLVVIAAGYRRMSRGSATAWLALWLTASIAIAKPELTVIAARGVGIQRGADLVLYCGLIGMLVGFFAVYVKLRRLEGTITTVVRQIAIDRAPPPTSRETTESGAEPPR